MQSLAGLNNTMVPINLSTVQKIKKLRQKTGKMSSELINLIHIRSPFIYSHICNGIRLLTLLLKNPYFLISSAVNVEQKKNHSLII